MNIANFIKSVNSAIHYALVLKKGLLVNEGVTIKDDLIVKTGDVIFNDIQIASNAPPIPPPPLFTPAAMLALPPGTICGVPLPDNQSAVLLIRLPLDDGTPLEMPF